VADVGWTYLGAVRDEFLRYRRLAEAAVAQLSPDEVVRSIDPESNSVAAIMQHIAGNLTSRFTDFLTTDGEKATRDRDAEFVTGTLEPESLARAWQEGWSTLFASLDALSPEDLERGVTIREEPHTVVAALERSLAHTAHHVGQIVFLAKHLRGSAWRTLSIPRGASRTWRPRDARTGGGEVGAP
jgi:hypothetical protein